MMSVRKTSFEKSKADILERLRKHFGDARGMLAFMLTQLSVSGQPCDITFRDDPPILDVVVDPKMNIPLLYGASGEWLQKRMETISLSNGKSISFSQIWTVHPMPVGGLSTEALASVDIDEGEQRFGPNGETLREMIRNVYHCKSKADEEKFLRRYLAS